MKERIDDAFFPLGEAYALGQKMAREIEGHMHACVPGPACDPGVIAQMVHNAGDGHHLHLGGRCAGCAGEVILAGRIKDHYGLGGKVVWLAHGDRSGDVNYWDTVERFQLGFRMELVLAEVPGINSIPRLSYRSGLICAGTEPQGAWDLIKSMVSKFVLIGGYDRAHQGAEETLRIAINEFDWRMVLLLGNSVLMERVGRQQFYR